MACMPIRQLHSLIEIEHPIPDGTYTYNLQMYNTPPSGYIKLEELEQWCVNRLRVLTLVEKILLRNYNKSAQEYVTMLISELESNGIHDFANLINTRNYNSYNGTQQYLTRNDCMSHFMLRSAFSFEDAKRQWFFTQEATLFKWRLSLLNENDMKTFINVNELLYSTISEEEKQESKEDLRMCYSEIENVENTTFYKIHFTSVIKPVKKRQIFLKDGIAYVPETKLFWLIVPEFKKILYKSFAHAREIASNTYGDERITKVLTLPNFINTQKFNYSKCNELCVNELDQLSRTSYPLCMRLLHEALRAKHHLRNGGRVQYCLFLKGIGLSLNNAIQFWKDELIQAVNEQTFEKEYKYYIKHLYGNIGKCANYEPFPCFKILNSTVGLNDDHGCPYKCMELHVLKNIVSKCGLVRSDIDSIVQLSKEGRYLQACKTYYEATHNCIIEKTFDHPNVYFAHSLKRIETVCSDTED